MSRLPLIGNTVCTAQLGLHAYHTSGDKYVRTVFMSANGMPQNLPAPAEFIDPTDIIDGLDDFLFTSFAACATSSSEAGQPMRTSVVHLCSIERGKAFALHPHDADASAHP